MNQESATKTAPAATGAPVPAGTAPTGRDITQALHRLCNLSGFFIHEVAKIFKANGCSMQKTIDAYKEEKSRLVHDFEVIIGKRYSKIQAWLFFTRSSPINVVDGLPVWYSTGHIRDQCTFFRDFVARLNAMGETGPAAETVRAELRAWEKRERQRNIEELLNRIESIRKTIYILSVMQTTGTTSAGGSAKITKEKPECKEIKKTA
jgi:hypothetical protein